jgi:alpha-glucosidase
MHEWWQRGTVYQIYPRSYSDSNADGTGDLNGILGRLDYLADLGVDAIWISPIFPSPMADFGYDVSDYTNVDPLFGSLEDLDRLIHAAHQRSMKVLLDYVPNHTSDQHPWFVESRQSRGSEKRDWYIWRDPKPDGSPPSNWLSVFGGSAWELDAATGQSYYHAYLKQQPDLNWRNSAVRTAMLEVLRFWFERGIDGFRIDALRQLIKDDQLRDNPADQTWSPGRSPYGSLVPLYTTDRPEMEEIISAFRNVADVYPERVLIGELYLSIERLMRYYGVSGRGLHLPFNFHLIETPWQAQAVGALVETYEAALPAGAWPNWVLGNHDRPRIASRVGADQARVAAMLVLTLRGTPTLYQGDELGMQDVPIPAAAVRDPVERNLPGLGLGRDPERTPMQWDATPNAGFTAPTARPWLPLATDYATMNVAVQRKDPKSMLSLHRRLIALRRSTPALSVGSYRQVHVDEDVLMYARDGLTVALNFAHVQRELPGPASGMRVLLSTYLDDAAAPSSLRPDEGVILTGA